MCFFYENVDQPFFLDQFYLDVFSCVLFSNLKKKLPILFNSYFDTFRNQQKCPTSIMFQERILEKFYSLSADLVFECIRISYNA